MPTAETIVVLGAGGAMGFATARNLARAGLDVRGWSRCKDAAQPLAADGVRVLDTPAQAAEGATVILTMLADADAVLESMKGVDGALAAPLGAKPVWLQMSTIGEAGTDRCIALARERAVAFVDAPVLGINVPTHDGDLVILCSGPERLEDRLAPVLDVIGRRTRWIGNAGNGTRLKLATNGWIRTAVEGGVHLTGARS
jgi:3-hydroxyisobutyrate dehydrogenase